MFFLIQNKKHRSLNIAQALMALKMFPPHFVPIHYEHAVHSTRRRFGEIPIKGEYRKSRSYAVAENDHTGMKTNQMFVSLSPFHAPPVSIFGIIRQTCNSLARASSTNQSTCCFLHPTASLKRSLAAAAAAALSVLSSRKRNATEPPASKASPERSIWRVFLWRLDCMKGVPKCFLHAVKSTCFPLLVWLGSFSLFSHYFAVAAMKHRRWGGKFNSWMGSGATGSQSRTVHGDTILLISNCTNIDSLLM